MSKHKRRPSPRRRWLATAIAAAALVLWLASGRFGVTAVWATSPLQGWSAGIWCGSFIVGHFDYSASPLAGTLLVALRSGVQWLSRPEFGVAYRLAWIPTLHYGPSGPDLLAVPLWPIPLVLMVRPVLLWCAHLRRGPSARSSACEKCGYDMTGARPTSSSVIACPECGSQRRESYAEIVDRDRARKARPSAAE